jgi:hypothetical protein
MCAPSRFPRATEDNVVPATESTLPAVWRLIHFCANPLGE